MTQLNRSAPSKTGRARRERNPSWRSELLERQAEKWAEVREIGAQPRTHLSDKATYVLGDAIQWLAELPPNSIHAVVTDPPYGVVEYEGKNHEKLKKGRGGVWRIPPSFDGAKRKPLPRFTVLSQEEITGLYNFFGALAYGLQRALVPGGHILMSITPDTWRKIHLWRNALTLS